ncbi:Uncharacterised protein [Chlamydia trachomatis]|nr:Uncharacterised protein [Chlamydia trachomatis]
MALVCGCRRVGTASVRPDTIGSELGQPDCAVGRRADGEMVG